MTRDNMVSKNYWDERITFLIDDIEEMLEKCKTSSANPSYRPQYVFELVKNYWHLILRRYSRGDSIKELAQYFEPMLDAWEESNHLHLEFRTVEELKERRDWSINLDHYIICFWLIGLALTLEIPNDQWQRLLALIGNEGNDILLDRIIATREPTRKIGNNLCHPKPYQRLLKAIDAPVDKQAKLFLGFVDKWYPELNRRGTKEMPAMYARPYWYNFGQPDYVEGGCYFGYWCIEAVAAVKAFGLDDTLCLRHPHYPGDLLRPNGPSTHQIVVEERGMLPLKEQNVSEIISVPLENALPSKTGWFKSLLGKK